MSSKSTEIENIYIFHSLSLFCVLFDASNVDLLYIHIPNVVDTVSVNVSTPFAACSLVGTELATEFQMFPVKFC